MGRRGATTKATTFPTFEAEMPKGEKEEGEKGREGKGSQAHVPSFLPSRAPFMTAKKAPLPAPSRGDANSGLKNQGTVRKFQDIW